MLQHLPHHSDPARTRVGAIVIYGPATGEHSSLVYQAGADPLLWSHGFDGGPQLIRLSKQRTLHRGPVTFLDDHPDRAGVRRSDIGERSSTQPALRTALRAPRRRQRRGLRDEDHIRAARSEPAAACCDSSVRHQIRRVSDRELQLPEGDQRDLAVSALLAGRRRHQRRLEPVLEGGQPPDRHAPGVRRVLPRRRIRLGGGWDGGERPDALLSSAPNERGKPHPERFDPRVQQQALAKWRQVHGGVDAGLAKRPKPKAAGSSAPSFPGNVLSYDRWRKTQRPTRACARSSAV